MIISDFNEDDDDQKGGSEENEEDDVELLKSRISQLEDFIIDNEVSNSTLLQQSSRIKTLEQELSDIRSKSRDSELKGRLLMQNKLIEAQANASAAVGEKDDVIRQMRLEIRSLQNEISKLKTGKGSILEEDIDGFEDKGPKYCDEFDAILSSENLNDLDISHIAVVGSPSKLSDVGTPFKPSPSKLKTNQESEETFVDEQKSCLPPPQQLLFESQSSVFLFPIERKRTGNFNPWKPLWISLFRFQKAPSSPSFYRSIMFWKFPTSTTSISQLCDKNYSSEARFLQELQSQGGSLKDVDPVFSIVNQSMIDERSIVLRFSSKSYTLRFPSNVVLKSFIDELKAAYY